jgi:outer membrane protein OmpA-like peptidoglycan-associated protein
MHAALQPETEAIPLPGVATGAAPAGAPGGVLAAVRQSIGGEFSRHAARFVGEDPARTETAVELLALAILRRLARRGTTAEGAARLFGQLGSADIDHGLLAVTALLLGDAPVLEDGRYAAGEQAAHALFGRWTDSLAFDVGSAVGLGADAVSRLLGLATPVVLAALRDHVRAHNLDAAALGQRLEGEMLVGAFARRRTLRREVAAAIQRTPRWGHSALVHAAESLARRDRWDLVHYAVVGALAVTAAAIAWFGLAGGAQVSPGPPVAALANGLGASWGNGVDRLRAFLAGDAPEVEFVFALDGIRFEPGSATLKSESNAQLRQLARVLHDFPTARITIEANERDQDLALVERRALAVRAALAAFGIRPSRMAHAGNRDAGRPGSRIEARATKE